MLNYFIKSFISALLLITVSSCATIVNGTRQKVNISSNPSNACVWLDRMYVGNTPILVDMSREDNHYVRIELDGYLPYEINFSKRISAWVAGNVVFGGLIGIAVDAMTGGIYRLTPEQVRAELCANTFVRARQTDDSYIAIVMQPDPSWQQIGTLKAK